MWMRSRQEVKERCCSKLWLNITEYKSRFLLVDTAVKMILMTACGVRPAARCGRKGLRDVLSIDRSACVNRSGARARQYLSIDRQLGRGNSGRRVRASKSRCGAMPPFDRLSRQARLLGDDRLVRRRVGSTSHKVCWHNGLGPAQSKRAQQGLHPRRPIATCGRPSSPNRRRGSPNHSGRRRHPPRSPSRLG